MPDDLDDRLTAAALLLDTPEKFRAVQAEVRTFALGISLDALRGLAQRFYAPPDVPAGFRPEHEKRPRSFAWSLLWQETVCEVFFQRREAGLPALREAAFRGEGLNDAMAFSLLCRLAAEGVGRAQFLEDTRREFPAMAAEAQVFAVNTLFHQGIRPTDTHWRQARRDPEYQALLDSLKDMPGYQEAEQSLWASGEEQE